MTAEQLLRQQPSDKRCELVNGRMIVREPAGHRHGRIANQLAYLLTRYLDDRDPRCGVRRRDRLRAGPRPGYGPGTRRGVRRRGSNPRARIERAGTRLVWVVDAVRRQIRVYRENGSQSVVAESERLDGENVVPGFSCALDAIF
jgi:Uma2 family endonuclease